jgi:hypothetical protein
MRYYLSAPRNRSLLMCDPWSPRNLKDWTISKHMKSRDRFGRDSGARGRGRAAETTAHKRAQINNQPLRS